MKFLSILFQYKFIVIFMLFGNIGFSSIDGNSVLENQLLKSTFDKYDYQKPKLRRFIDFKEKSFIYKVNPITYLSGGLMFFYQNVVSQQFQADCNYEYSCSEYTKLSIQKYGFFIGTLKGIHQLTNCTNNIFEEHEWIRVSPDFKVINPIFEE